MPHWLANQVVAAALLQVLVFNVALAWSGRYPFGKVPYGIGDGRMAAGVVLRVILGHAAFAHCFLTVLQLGLRHGSTLLWGLGELLCLAVLATALVLPTQYARVRVDVYHRADIGNRGSSDGGISQTVATRGALGMDLGRSLG